MKLSITAGYLILLLLQLNLVALAEPASNLSCAVAYAEQQSSPDTPALAIQQSTLLLKGKVSETPSPFNPDGSTATIPAGMPVQITLTANVNSEISQVGEPVRAMVSFDIKRKGQVLLPGQWYVLGKVTKVEQSKRAGCDGYIEIKFEKLVSPDGKYEVPFEAIASTKDSIAKSVAKHVAKDTGYVAVGALGGAILSVQLTGIPLAVASHGYSVAAGAAIGATLGAVAAIHRKGNILCVMPGDELNIKINKAITLPAFNPKALPSAIPVPTLENLTLNIKQWHFDSDPFGDKLSRLLTVSFNMENQTKLDYGFSNLAVISDHNKFYYPYILSSDIKQRSKRCASGQKEEATLTFSVDSPKYKYSLVLLDKDNTHIVSQIPVN